MYRRPGLRILLEIPLGIYRGVHLFVERDRYEAAVVIIRNGHAFRTGLHHVDVSREQFAVQPVLFRILGVQKILRELLFLEHGLVERRLSRLQKRKGLLTHEVRGFAVRIEIVYAPGKRVEKDGIEIRVLLKIADVELPRGPFAVGIYPRPAAAVFDRRDYLDEPFCRCSRNERGVIALAAVAQHLTADSRGYPADTCHDCAVAARKTRERTDLLERCFVLRRRVLINDARQKLAVSVDIYRDALDRVDYLTCLEVCKHYIAVL